MKIEKTYAVALALAGTLAVTATTPSFAKSAATAHAAAQYAQPLYQGDAYDDSVVQGHFAPGSTGYGRQAYNPEQPTDPDPRIGGAFKMSTDR